LLVAGRTDDAYAMAFHHGGTNSRPADGAVAYDAPTLMAQAASRRVLSRSHRASPVWQRLREKARDHERRAQGRPDPVCESCWECVGTDLHSDRVFPAHMSAPVLMP
jgi:hypothetical protein